MNWKGIRIHVVLVVFALGTLLLLGGQWAFDRYQVKAPLERRILAIQGVKSVKLVQAERNTQMEVVLSGAKNFRDTYLQLQRAGRHYLGTDMGSILLVDTRSTGLESAYTQMSFDIQEAIATGGFSRMRESLELTARNLKLDHFAVYVDSAAVYVALSKSGHELYEVVPRSVDKSSGIGGENSV